MEDKVKQESSKVCNDNLPQEMSTLIRNLLRKHNITGIVDIKFNLTADTGRPSIASGRHVLIVTFEDDRKPLELFLKECQGKSAMINDKVLTFQKERCAYDSLLPALVNFQKNNTKKGSHCIPIESFIFQSYGSGNIGKDVFILLELFNSMDYAVSKGEFHSIDQIHYALKVMATFHATSFAMKLINGVDWLKEYPILVDKLTDPEAGSIVAPFFVGWFKNVLKVMNAVSKETMESNSILIEHDVKAKFSDSVLDRLTKLSDKVMCIMHNTQKGIEAMNLVCHGDFHMWNIAFALKGNMHAKLFDFQVIRYSTGLTDVHQYLTQVSTPEMRKKHLSGFLKMYCDTFKSTCDDYKLEDAKNSYTMDAVLEEYHRTSAWGFLYGFMFTLSRFLCSDFTESIEAVEDTSKIIDLLCEKGSSGIWDVVKINIDIIVEAEENGTIDIMEKMSVSE